MKEITVKFKNSYFMGVPTGEVENGLIAVIPERSCGAIPGLTFGVVMWIPESSILYR